jgi:hypothetical protein
MLQILRDGVASQFRQTAGHRASAQPEHRHRDGDLHARRAEISAMSI